ncbi:MAG: helix-turn-helix transcriptional regulator [Halobacteriota archaeon]|nr:helix-turn-helix transcriptional regulator [Halobacteriota archaeon]
MIDVFELRKELGLSQTELAVAMGVSFSTVSRWENGQSYPKGSHDDLLIAMSSIFRAAALNRRNAKRVMMVIGIKGLIALAAAIGLQCEGGGATLGAASGLLEGEGIEGFLLKGGKK